ncbi:MAG: hypothetical protein WC604_02285 [Candidatus Gracilibacteria bacterium]
MTNKGKVLAAVVAVAVVLVAGVGLYLKGGDLMGRLGLKKVLPAYNEQVVCPSGSAEALFSSLPSSSGSYLYDSFDELYGAIKTELSQNNGKLVCPLRIQVSSSENQASYGQDLSHIICRGNDLVTTTINGQKAIICNRDDKYFGAYLRISKNTNDKLLATINYMFSETKDIDLSMRRDMILVERLPSTW